MTRKCGRPPKGANPLDAEQTIIDSTIMLIKKFGAESITIRNVCEEAHLSIGTFYHYFQNKDDLLMHFVRMGSFDRFNLETPKENIVGRICELYMYLISRYRELGEDFMKSFYTTGNKALSAYMGEEDGHFPKGTVMARCEKELVEAQNEGYLLPEEDPHQLSRDICIIVKGCVFEWALNDGKTDIETCLFRILKAYMSEKLNKGK